MTDSVEALKIALKQEPEGILVTFRIQPEDLPTGLLVARINARFALAMQEIDDNEQAKPPEPKEIKNKRKQNANVMRAAILCGEPRFQLFLQDRYPRQWKRSIGKGEPADVLRDVLGITSRRELATDPKVLAAFDTLTAEYEMWKKGE